MENFNKIDIQTVNLKCLMFIELSHRQNQYSFYLWLLYHYLTDFYRSSDPKMKFAELQNCIKNIRELGHTMHKHLISGGILTQVFAENACQVLCEVLGFFDAFPDDRSMIKWQRNTC